MTGLPPLDAKGILWLAAIDRLPIDERIEWVQAMNARVEQINQARKERKGEPPPGTLLPASDDRRALGAFLARVEKTCDDMDRREASGWIVVCIDCEQVARGDADAIVACYGPHGTPEAALVAAGVHEATSLEESPDELGWAHFVKPLFPDPEERP